MFNMFRRFFGRFSKSKKERKETFNEKFDKLLGNIDSTLSYIDSDQRDTLYGTSEIIVYSADGEIVARAKGQWYDYAASFKTEIEVNTDFFQGNEAKVKLIKEALLMRLKRI